MQIDDLYELPCPDSGRAAEQTERRPPDSVGVSRSAGGVRRGRNGTRCGKSISAEPSPSLQTAIFQPYFLPQQVVTPAVAAPLADQSGQRGHCQQFHVVAQMALCGGTGNLLPQFSNKNWMGFAKSLTVASGEIPFSSQERSFLLQNLQWRSHSPFRNRTRRDGKNSTSVFPSRPQQSPGAVRSPAEAPAFPTAHCG